MATRKKRSPHGYASNLDAAQKTVLRLEQSGALEEADPDLVHAFLALAAAVDAFAEKADLWREYRQTGRALREAVAVGVDDDTASFLVSIQTPGRAKVGNS